MQNKISTPFALPDVEKTGLRSYLSVRYYVFFLLTMICLTACGNSQSPVIKQRQLSRQADSISRQQFQTLEFIVDNKPALAVIDTRYKDFKNKKEFPLSLFITINTVDRDNNGHPTVKEAGIYKNIEGDIMEELDGRLISAFIGRTTMDGYRDLIFYIKSSDQDKVTRALTKLQQKHSRIKEFVFENDPEWEAVSDFFRAVKQN